MKAITLVVLLCVTRTLAEDSFENSGVRGALKVYDECSKYEFFPCLKKKALVMLDRLSRMDRISIVDGVAIVKADEFVQGHSNATEGEEERNLSKDKTLDELFVERFTRLLGSRKLEISLPEINSKLEGKSDIDCSFLGNV